MRVDIVTIFPGYFAPLDLSLIGRARAQGLLDVTIHDLRTWADDRHRSVDDTPFGGGPGMVMSPVPWGAALDEVMGSGPGGSGTADRRPLLVVPTPAGRPFRQADAERLAGTSWLVFACGRYEGIDARVVDSVRGRWDVEEPSLGDFVVGGGEVAVLVLLEAIARLLPGVLGNADSLREESHAEGLLEYPVYTRPASWRGLDVPPVLLSGNHAAIRRWRRDESLRRTAARRPDLVARLPVATLDEHDLRVLADAGWTVGAAARLVRVRPAVAD